MPVEPSVVRLKRILVLVPWVIAHGGAGVEEVCARFGMTTEELAADIDLLMVCGLPPFGPGDLIWAAMEEGRVTIEMAEYLARPPRLTRAEALALLIMGRAVAELPGLEEAESLRRALAKLAGAIAPAEAESARALAERIEVELETTGADLLGDLRGAIDEHRRLRINYYSHGRGEMTEREIDPLLVFGAMANWYVVALDHRSGEERVFRVDRIKEAVPTGETFEPPEDFDAGRHATGSLFTPSPRDLEVTLDLSPAAAWMSEVITWEALEQLPDGWTRMRLRTPHLAWLVNLLLTVGEGARPVSPPELGARVREEAARALAAYGS